MSKDLMLNSNGDLQMDNGNFNFVSGKQELIQALSNAIMTEKGSAHNKNIGLNTSFLLGGYDENSAISAIKECLMQDRRVINVESVNAQKNGNKVVFTISVATTLGQLNFQKGVELNGTYR